MEEEPPVGAKMTEPKEAKLFDLTIQLATAALAL